jgi:hypothetical protein
MIEVVLDERLFRLADGLFDRMKLLCDIKARPIALAHFDHADKMAFVKVEARVGFSAGTRRSISLVDHKLYEKLILDSPHPSRTLTSASLNS